MARDCLSGKVQGWESATIVCNRCGLDVCECAGKGDYYRCGRAGSQPPKSVCKCCGLGACMLVLASFAEGVSFSYSARMLGLLVTASQIEKVNSSGER